MIPQRVVSVSLSVTRVPAEKMAERIYVLFGVESRRDPMNILLDGGPGTPVVRVGGSMRPSPVYFGHLLSTV